MRIIISPAKKMREDVDSLPPKGLPALLGAGITLVSLLLVGQEEMLLPALALIVIALTLLRPRLEGREEESGPGKREEEPQCR